MRGRYRVSVGGVHLDTLDDNLLILDVDDTQPEITFKKQNNANLNGVDITDTYVGQRTVTVTFELHIYSIAKRNEACQKVNEWASKGGNLVKNDRSAVRLERVVCEQYADINSARNWTDPLTVVFRTTDNPYWVSNAQTSIQIANSAKGTLPLDGNVGNALVSVTATAQATLTSYQITVGDTKIRLTGLNVPEGKQIIIDYLSGRYLRIRANGANVIPRLDPTSSDLLLAPCGQNTSVSISANAKVTSVITARGCWL